MNIYLHELKMYRKSTLIWSFSLAALIIILFSMFPAFSAEASKVQELLKGYPENIRKALSLNINTISSLLGFYSFIFLYVLLCGSVQAMNLGISILSMEMRQKTADFLLTKPVTRSKIITWKILAALTCIFITNVFYLASATIMAETVKSAPYSRKLFFMISITLIFVQLMFFSLGILFSVSAKRIKSVLPISLGNVFLFFIISMFSSATDDSSLRYITPFKYFDAQYIIKNASYESSFVIVEIFFIILSITLSYILYLKKDIHTV